MPKLHAELQSEGLARERAQQELSLLQALDGELAANSAVPGKLAIKDGQRIVRVDQQAIGWIDAAGDYLCIHTPDETFVLRATLRDMEQRLDPRRFQRIHRSTIVNMRAIQSIGRDDTGKGTIKLKKRPETLSVSQPFMALFKHM